MFSLWRIATQEWPAQSPDCVGLKIKRSADPDFWYYREQRNRPVIRINSGKWHFWYWSYFCNLGKHLILMQLLIRRVGGDGRSNGFNKSNRNTVKACGTVISNILKFFSCCIIITSFSWHILSIWSGKFVFCMDSGLFPVRFPAMSEKKVFTLSGKRLLLWSLI